ncbi:DegT/DnrJ/EryC1/StrS family aminotransferase [Niabella pedocola]|uniref:DegT/DnrJ/EryC1/StrS family aminotransferase n=1 Tax=Niabella pedocola TaxID=1752077 RepID=A0ABS8PMH0_9BACT|nr:DegT/DnrJ/EryC1/StrS family aminotransferase [Niabella pedocola]MCD2422300.1 DegT/DnrJ/EryC1/StrS family aminotransferase [Niabella pedocola]
MRPLYMVDTHSQYHKIKHQVDKAVLDVMESTAFINGKAVKEFAGNLAGYLGVKHVIPCANGTDALQIALMALGLQPGDEVITPSFTYIATTEVIALLRLTPVFVEVDAKTFCIDPVAIEKAITPKTKAIVPVHLYGQSADMEAIMKIAEKYNLAVVEDNAQAIGCDFHFSDGTSKKTGTIGHIGCTSFYPSKNLGAFGDGGAMCTNDDVLAEKLRMIANHGQKERYYHEVVGCNSRLDSIQAAILNVKLAYLDDYCKARQEVAAYYDKAFETTDQIITPFKASNSDHVYHQYTIILEGVNRDAFKARLDEKGIPSMIYYPVPAHKQKMFEQFEVGALDLPLTSYLTERVISLPVHTEMDEVQLKFITDTVLSVIENNDN